MNYYEKPLKNPFPGLRPFEEHEESYFFGREKAVTDLMAQLRTTRFLPVIGTSGSGKSSLIIAGLLPALYRGLMVQAGSHWRVALFRPGGDPIGNLARVLVQNGIGNNSPGGSSDNDAVDPVFSRLTEASLRRSDRGLVDVVKEARLPKHENLLIVVDQFEELFRFSRLETAKKDGKRDSSAFVKLLLETRFQTGCSIYIIITMRSDFLGDCTIFRGLPEAVNNGQYLVPRMTRDERRSAVIGPTAVAGGKISPPLLSRLLNDVGDNPDQLPILQHALMRTWDFWISRRRRGEPMDIRHYEAIGGMEEALSQHAEEAYAELYNEPARLTCAKLFKLITDIGETGRGVRRPAQLGEICRAVNASQEQVTEVIEVFRKPGRTFLMPPHHAALNENSVIDISHESFMRIWWRLQEWVKEESQSSELYGRLAKSAALHAEGKVGFWRDPELMLAVKWRDLNRPNAVWAKRYDPAFDRAMSFLDASETQHEIEIAEKEREQKAKIRRTRIVAAIVFIAAVISGIFGFMAVQNQREAEEQKRFALVEKENAQRAQKEAELQRTEAEKQKNIAQENELEAQNQKEEAERQKLLAVENEAAAKRAKLQAEKNERIAKINAIKEQLNGLVVDMNKEDANFRRTLAKSRELAVQTGTHTGDPELKALLAINAYRLHREAFTKLQLSTAKTFAGFDKNNLERGNKELAAAYRRMQEVYNVFQVKSGIKVVPPELFRALREAYITKSESGDTIYPNVESWALAVSGDRSLIFNTMDRELVSAPLESNDLPLPAINRRDAVRLPGPPLTATSMVETADRFFYGTHDGRIFYRDKNKPDVVKPLAAHAAKILSMVFSKTHRRLFYSVRNKIYRINLADIPDLADLADIREETGSDISNNDFLLDQLDEGVFIRTLTVIENNAGRSILVAADSKGNLFQYDATSGNMEKKPLNTDYKVGGIYSLAVNPASKRMAVGNAGGEIRLFLDIDAHRLASGKKISPVIFETKHKGIVRALAFSADGRFLASGGYGGTVMLWDLKLLEDKSIPDIERLLPILTINGDRKILSIAFADNGRTMIFSDSHNLRLCPTSPEPFYQMLMKTKKRDFTQEERQHYIGEINGNHSRRKQ